MIFLINTETDQLLAFESIVGAQYVKSEGDFPGEPVYKKPWRSATQEELDDYLLAQAKTKKVAALKDDLDEFMSAGLQYMGDIVCAAWDSEMTYALHDLVLATDSKNYQSLQNSNLNNDPVSSPGDWAEFTPLFRTDDEVMINLGVKKGSSSGSANRYKYYSVQESDGFRHFIDFGSNPDWTAFSEVLSDEKNRIMVKYNNYRTQIAMCADVAAVDALVIDFGN